MKKIYLASPFFNEEEKKNVKILATRLRNLGYDVYVPMEHTIENGWSLPNFIWGEKVYNEDVEAIKDCDEVYAIIYGMTDDAGTSWEIGFAYGIGKPITVIPINETVYSLMVMNSCKEVRILNDLETLSSKKNFLQS